MQRFIWIIYAVFMAFLLIVFISTQVSGGRAFGTDNIERLAPGASTMGNLFADAGDALGLDFQSVRTTYDSLDPHRLGIGTNVQHLNLKHDIGGALLVVFTWGLLATLIAFSFASVVGKLSSGGGGSSVAAAGCSGFWGFAVVLVLLAMFHGSLTDAVSYLSHQPQRSSQSAPIQNRIDRVQQSWTPGTLNRSCHVM